MLVGYQHNRRQEFEELETPDESGLDFMLHTLSYDMRYALQNANGLKVNAGIAGMYQRSLNKGEEVLIPAYALNDIGAYVTTGYKNNGWSMSGGLRADMRHVHSFALEDHFLGAVFMDFAKANDAGTVVFRGPGDIWIGVLDHLALVKRFRFAGVFYAEGKGDDVIAIIHGLPIITLHAPARAIIRPCKMRLSSSNFQK